VSTSEGSSLVYPLGVEDLKEGSLGLKGSSKSPTSPMEITATISNADMKESAEPSPLIT
jgi:hypothetical protein